MPAVAKTWWHSRERGRVSEVEHNILLEQMPHLHGGLGAEPLPEGLLYFQCISEAEPEPLARLVQLRQ